MLIKTEAALTAAAEGGDGQDAAAVVSLMATLIPFLATVGDHLENCCRAISDKGNIMCDLLAMAVAMCPELILESQDLHGCVELAGNYTRGQTSFDWIGKSKQPKNINVVMKVDSEAYHKLLSSVFHWKK